MSDDFGQSWGDYFGIGNGLLQAYLRGDYKPVVKPAVREALEYGATNSGWDWLAGDTGLTPSGSGLVGGGATLLSGLITGETEGLAGKTATAGIGGYAGNALARQAVQNAGASAGQPAFGGAMNIGGSSAVTGVMGAGVGGVATGMYEGFTKGKLSTGTGWGMVGGMVGSLFGPVGTFAGSVIGGLAAGMMGADAPKIREYAKYDNGTSDGIFYNEKTGRYEAGKVVDVGVHVGNELQNLSPGQKKGLAGKLQNETEQFVNELNERLAGVDAVLNNPSASQQDRDRAAYQKDVIMSQHNNSMMPQTDEELKAAYDEYVNSINTDNNQSAGKELANPSTALSYEDWKNTQGMSSQHGRQKKRIDTLLASMQMPEVTGYEQTESGLNPIYEKPSEKKKAQPKDQYDWTKTPAQHLQEFKERKPLPAPSEEVVASNPPGSYPFSLINALGGQNAEARK